jgi:phytoene dehydrogenase-like protein
VNSGSGASQTSYDVVIVGGGHNGLTAAALLARAGMSTLVLERLPETGGAAVSKVAFPGKRARLSRYSYLVSLMPDQLMRDLELDVELRSRNVASYTPYYRNGRHGGLLVERPESEQTRASFRELTGSEDEYAAWQLFYGDVAKLAAAVAPTLLEPLRTESSIAAEVDTGLWQDLVREPIGRCIERRFADDVVRGVVATDALIGTFADLHSPSLVQNKCFLYHLVGNGSGEWRVPVGGMGAVSDALLRAAVGAGAEVLTGAGVSRIATDGASAEVTWHDGTSTHSVTCWTVLSGVAPWVLRILLGDEAEPDLKPEGAQLKINFLLDHLPALRSGADPAVAFAGTLHVAEDYKLLQAAYADASSGQVPQILPGEVYCHTLADPSILGGEPGHTLTYFGVHTPASLFDSEENRADAISRALSALNVHLEEPIESCISVDENGHHCIEAKFPQDIEDELAMPGGHIFHGDLEWPWAPNRALLSTPGQRWGVATDIDNVLICGAGARRGGGVSGIGGHNAAQAVLEGR